MDLRFTNGGRIAITIMVIFIMAVQQCNIQTLEKKLANKPEPIIEHVKVFDTVKIEPEKPNYAGGQIFYYVVSALNSNDSLQYTTTILYHKNDLVRLPIGDNKSIEIAKILTNPVPVKN